MAYYILTTEDFERQQTCIKTVDRIISFFKKINKPIKLKRKALSPTRRWGNRKIEISTADNKAINDQVTKVFRIKRG